MVRTPRGLCSHRDWWASLSSFANHVECWSSQVSSLYTFENWRHLYPDCTLCTGTMPITAVYYTPWETTIKNERNKESLFKLKKNQSQFSGAVRSRWRVTRGLRAVTRVLVMEIDEIFRLCLIEEPLEQPELWLEGVVALRITMSTGVAWLPWGNNSLHDHCRVRACHHAINVGLKIRWLIRLIWCPECDWLSVIMWLFTASKCTALIVGCEATDEVGWSLSRKQVQRHLLENLLMTLLTMLPVLSV